MTGPQDGPTLEDVIQPEEHVTRDRTQIKFLLGWISRTLKDAT